MAEEAITQRYVQNHASFGRFMGSAGVSIAALTAARLAAPALASHMPPGAGQPVLAPTTVKFAGAGQPVRAAARMEFRMAPGDMPAAIRNARLQVHRSPAAKGLPKKEARP